MSTTPAVGSDQKLGSLLASVWAFTSRLISKLTASKTRRLRLCDSLSLGDKRILAIVECDRQRFLLAATPANISLLQSLGPADPDEAQEQPMP